jgi:hypothetical protein
MPHNDDLITPDRPEGWKMDYSDLTNITGWDGTLLTPFATNADKLSHDRRELWRKYREMRSLAPTFDKGLTMAPGRQQTEIDIENYKL